MPTVKHTEGETSEGAEPTESAGRDEALVVPRAALALLEAVADPESAAGPDPAAGRLLRGLGLSAPQPPAVRAATGRRAAAQDALCRSFLGRYPDGLVVSVGSLLGTRAQRVGRGRWLDVDPDEIAALRRQHLPGRRGYRQAGVSLEQPAGWLRALGRARRPLLLLLEEPLLALDESVLEALLDGVAAHLPPGTRVVVPTDRRWAAGIASADGARRCLVRCTYTLSYWPRLEDAEDELDALLQVRLQELRRASFLMRCRWVPTLFYLRLG